MSNRSYCSKLINECYSKNQYEYDELKPYEFIRICKYDANNSREMILKIAERTSEEMLYTISGWISVVAISISIILMIATLITYALFKELRTIPGLLVFCLTLTLCFAQFFFLLGSLINQFPIVCFIVSIVTHYAFISSFAWMHIIGFDLYR